MSSRIPVDIAIQPWFRDHCFNGKVILPAVEIMEILATAVQEVRPDIQPRVISDASFSKFLEIPAEATDVSALLEYEEGEKGEIHSKLLSRIQFKKISRVKEHTRLVFSARPQPTPDVAAFKQTVPAEPMLTVDAERIYNELVPFGPAYRTLTSNLLVSDKGAWGTLQAPLLAAEKQLTKTLGSPFPLDGAMHAACVFGQRVADFVPFPVGFSKRTIHHPTQAGKQYSTTIRPVSQTQEELQFDLAIFDRAGTLCETVKGLRMRDVSNGHITPPDWIKTLLPD